MKFTRDKSSRTGPPPHKPTAQPRSSQMLRPTAPAKVATPPPKPLAPQPKAAPPPRQKLTARPAPPPTVNPALGTPLGKAMATAVKDFDPDKNDYVAVRHAGVAAKIAAGYSRVGEVKDSTSDQTGTLVVMEKAR